MDTQTIIGFAAGFLASKIGIDLLVFLYKKLGEYTESTETKIDDQIYDVAPDFLEIIVENFDLGKADEILTSFLNDLEKVDADTSKLEEEVKVKRDEIKKQL